MSLDSFALPGDIWVRWDGEWYLGEIEYLQRFAAEIDPLPEGLGSQQKGAVVGGELPRQLASPARYSLSQDQYSLIFEFRRGC